MGNKPHFNNSNEFLASEKHSITVRIIFYDRKFADQALKSMDGNYEVTIARYSNLEGITP